MVKKTNQKWCRAATAFVFFFSRLFFLRKFVLFVAFQDFTDFHLLEIALINRLAKSYEGFDDGVKPFSNIKQTIIFLYIHLYVVTMPCKIS